MRFYAPDCSSYGGVNDKVALVVGRGPEPFVGLGFWEQVLAVGLKRTDQPQPSFSVASTKDESVLKPAEGLGPKPESCTIKHHPSIPGMYHAEFRPLSMEVSILFFDVGTEACLGCLAFRPVAQLLQAFGSWAPKHKLRFLSEKQISLFGSSWRGRHEGCFAHSNPSGPVH